MSVIFIDLGCSDGRSVEAALRGDMGLPKLRYDRIFAFDAIREPAWENEKWNDIPIEFFECAVGTAEGIVPISMTDNPEVRTTIPANDNYNLGDKRWVKVLNFSAWLRKNVRFEDTVVVKMDIEGAEYSILEQLIFDNTIHWINYLFVEFHDFCIGDEDEKEKFQERERVIREKCKIPIGAWA